MKLSYRSDIDGLRGIAVLSVLFFHTDVSGFSGGFVGVDIFFVISGFLITSIILKDIHENKFTISRFYERRIRRIFPALFPVIIFTIIVGSYLFDAITFKELGQSVAATTLFSSNILFWHTSGYFAGDSSLKPLLHTWSLAVEEQFYIFFPLAIIFIKAHLKSRYLFWLIILSLVSFAVSIYAVTCHPGAAFYFMPTRAWELLLGSILALDILPKSNSIWQRNILSAIGLGLILYSITFYSENINFPGYTALPPVIGSSLIIYCGNDEKNFSVKKILSIKPLVFIGLISYSLYLWHWTFVSFSKYLLFRSFNIYEKTFIIIASLVIATLSWKYIEKPFRAQTPLIKEQHKLFITAGSLLFIISCSGLLIYHFNGIGIRNDLFYPQLNVTIQKAQAREEIGHGTPLTFGYNKTKPSFALCGDSHAWALLPALDQQAKSSNLSGVMLSNSTTPFLLGVNIIQNKNDDSFDEAFFNSKTLQYIKTHSSIRTIILAGRWAIYTKGYYTCKSEDPCNFKLVDITGQCGENKKNAFILESALKRTVNTLLSLGCKVILVCDVPEIGYDVPRVYSIYARWPAIVNLDKIRPTIKEYHERQKEAQAIMEKLAKLPEVTIIYPQARMFDQNGKGKIIEQGNLLYNDYDHLSAAGARFVAPAFNKAFEEMAAEQKNISMDSNNKKLTLTN
jgi:peptidoglycan/LPS O-acetylase OafA/YrhL